MKLKFIEHKPKNIERIKQQTHCTTSKYKFIASERFTDSKSIVQRNRSLTRSIQTVKLVRSNSNKISHTEFLQYLRAINCYNQN